MLNKYADAHVACNLSNDFRQRRKSFEEMCDEIMCLILIASHKSEPEFEIKYHNRALEEVPSFVPRIISFLRSLGYLVDGPSKDGHLCISWKEWGDPWGVYDYIPATSAHQYSTQFTDQVKGYCELERYARAAISLEATSETPHYWVRISDPALQIKEIRYQLKRRLSKLYYRVVVRKLDDQYVFDVGWS